MTISNLPSIKTHFRIQTDIQVGKDQYFSNPNDYVEEKLAGETTVIDFAAAN